MKLYLEEITLSDTYNKLMHAFSKKHKWIVKELDIDSYEICSDTWLQAFNNWNIVFDSKILAFSTNTAHKNIYGKCIEVITNTIYWFWIIK